jgi:hypothetical protein
MKIGKKLTRDIINYGFDSFAGFPPVDAPQDQWNNFESQYKQGLFQTYTSKMLIETGRY